MNTRELARLSYELRAKVVDVITGAKTGHIGGDMSVMDILVMLYFKHTNIGPDNQDDAAHYLQDIDVVGDKVGHQRDAQSSKQTIE